MRLVTFERSGQQRLGGLLGETRILDLNSAQRRRTGAADTAFESMQSLIEAGPGGWDRARTLLNMPAQEDVVERASVRLRAPLPRPVRLRDCSLFLEHMEKALKLAGSGQWPQLRTRRRQSGNGTIHVT